MRVLVLIVTAGLTAGLPGVDTPGADPRAVLGTGSPREVLQELGAVRTAMQRDAFLWTPLMLAAADNPHPGTVTMLLEQGEDPERRSLDDWNALMFAAAFNPEPEVVKVLLEAGMDPNGRTRDAWVAAYGVARYTGRIVQIESLGFGREEDESGERQRGWTPLFFAARYNQEPRVTELLLEAGAEADARDEHGLTPLDYARDAGRERVVTILEEAHRR